MQSQLAEMLQVMQDNGDATMARIQGQTDAAITSLMAAGSANANTNQQHNRHYRILESKPVQDIGTFDGVENWFAD